MTWLLIHQGAVVSCGTYAQVLDTAEEWRVLERAYHRDGTEYAPRWMERGWSMRLESARVRRRVAA